MVIQTINTSGCCPQTIVIGRRGTYDTMRIAFDLSYLVESFGNGVAVLAVKRSQDESAYPAIVTQEDATLLWIVNETDTAYVGSGECQLMWYVDGGLAKTIIYPMVVMRDILQTAEQPPDGYENWIEHLTELGAETHQNAQNAAQSASDAEQSATDAGAAKDAANEAVLHYPKIENGYWYVWDVTAQAYQNTNIKAEGDDGYSPEVTITSIEGGHRITITDKDHPQGQSFDVLDGQGGGGTSDYTDLTNKPQINGHTLDGNKSASDLGLGTYSKPADGIPKTDLAQDVQQSLRKADTALQTAPVTSVNSKTGAVTLGAGDIGYDGETTYPDASVGKELTTINSALSSLSDDLDDVESDVSDCFVYLNKIAVEEPGKNLNNPATDTNNCWIGYSGEAATLTDYSISDFIEVEVGKTYAFGGYRNFAPYALIKTRTLCAYYDANKAYISESRQNVDNTSGLVVTIPDGVKYIRISSHTVGGYLMIVESSTVPENYIPYVVEMVVKAKVPELEELSPLIGTTEYKALRNWYNPDTSEEGFLQYTGNIDSSPTGTIYSTSALIPVKPNTNYYISLYNPLFQLTSLRIIAAGYDENGVFQASSYVNQERVSSITYNSGNYSYIKVCARAEREGNHLMVTEDPDSTVFFEYNGKTYSSLSVDSSNVPEYPVLYGKKWAVCGDSFTNSGGTGTLIPDGIYKGRPFTYPWIIGGRNNMEIAKFFDGGKTLAFPASPGDFDNGLTNPNADWFYQNIPSDVDYITIYLGINDEHHATGGGDGEDPTGVIPLGTIDDNTTATYFGAWNVVLTWLITNRPNAHIGIIVTNGLSIEAYRNAQISIARKYGIPFIDLNGDDRTPAMLRTINPNIPSAIKQALIAKWAVDPTGAGGEVNTHPNDAAQLFESTVIENFLKSL